jgi:1,4-dihydroxy-2-naphthoate octaprenyltransferase
VPDLKTWVAGARPRTLPAAVVPVLVGTACAAGVYPWMNAEWLTIAPNAGVLVTDDGALKGLSLWRFAAALIVALALQVGTNYANDYSDGKRGTDDPGQRTGPPRLVGWGLAPAKQVKAAALISFAVAAVAGLTLAAAVSWWLILVGVVSIAAGWFYTGGPRPYGYAGYGELFVFVFFGLVATVGSAFVQTGYLWRRVEAGAMWVEAVPGRWDPPATVLRDPHWSAYYPWLTLAAAAAVGFLATALLVVNNLRDIPSDTASGKRTLAVKLGDRRTRILYVVLIVLPFVMVPFIAGLGGRPLGAAALFAILLAHKPVLAVLQGATGPALIPVLGQTGRVQLVFGVLLAAGLFISA